MKRIAAFCLFSLMLTNIAYAQETEMSAKKAQKAPAPDCASIGDQAITSEVQQNVAKAPSLKNFRIAVATESGVVTLTGTVKTSANKATATRAAKRAKCVKKVDNQLAVEEPSSPASKNRKAGNKSS
jgi:osmotically-inducible protein OsmY